MRFFGKMDWETLGLSAEQHRLFALQWAEMFGEIAPSAWRVRTMNIRTSLDEIRSVAGAAREFSKARHNLPHVLQEAEKIARLDPVVTKHFPFVPEYLRGLSDKPADKMDLDRLCDVSTLVSTYLYSYRERLILELRAVLADKDFSKEVLGRLIMALGTEIFSAGYSVQHLREALDRTVCVRGDADFMERFDALLALCSGQRRTFRCIFPISHRIEKIGEMQGVTVHAAWPLPDSPKVKSLRESGAQFAEVRVEALDQFIAAREADRQLTAIFAALSVYQPNRSPQRVGSHVAVESGGSQRVVKSDVQTALHDTLDGFAKGARLMRLRGQLDAQDRDRLDATLEYHRLALTAGSFQARLVNMWIGLESLVRRENESIIESVCAVVPAVLALGNVRRLVRALAIYLRKARVLSRMGADEVRRIFPASSEVAVEVGELLTLLASPVEGDEMKSVLAACDENPLIRYRLYRVAAKVLASHKTALDNLHQNRQNVDWQLRRIYRARNEIVHRAGDPYRIDQLVEHLHAYLVSTVQVLVHTLEVSDGAWSIRQVMEHHVRLFDLLTARLREKKPIPLQSFLEADRILHSANQVMWPSPAAG